MKDLFALLEHFQDRPVAYYKAYTMITGSITAGVLLSQLVYWDRVQHHQEFYKTNEDLKEELGMGIDELKSAKKKIMKFVDIQIKGIPAKTYYKLDREALINSLTSWWELHEQVSDNPANKLVDNAPTSWRESHGQVGGSSTSQLVEVPLTITENTQRLHTENISSIEDIETDVSLVSVSTEISEKSETENPPPTPSLVVAKEFGDHDINEIIRAIIEAHGTIDGTVKSNRIFGKHLKTKLSGIKGFDGRYYEFICMICTQSDQYRISKTTSCKLIYDNLASLIANLKTSINPKKSTVGKA